MDVKLVKALILFGLLVGSFLIGFIPVKCIWYFQGRPNNRSTIVKVVISVLSCFAAGVFMATCLMDLLPETREALEEHTKDSEKFHHYPVAEFIMIMGLMLMLTVEQAVMTFQDRHGRRSRVLSTEKENVNERNTLLGRENETGFRTSYSSSGLETDTESYRERDRDEQRHSDFENSVSMSVKTVESDNSTFRSVLLLIALSLHSIFEGLAVGLQKSSTDVLEVFVGLCLHKVILAFSLGTTLTQSKLSFWAQIRSLLTFAFASPIGIAIGLIIMEYGSGTSSSLAEGILQGIACGTFLYVTFFEILQHELGIAEFRLVKTLFLFIGFMCMSGLLLIHDHEGE